MSTDPLPTRSLIWIQRSIITSELDTEPEIVINAAAGSEERRGWRCGRSAAPLDAVDLAALGTIADVVPLVEELGRYVSRRLAEEAR